MRWAISWFLVLVLVSPLLAEDELTSIAPLEKKKAERVVDKKFVAILGVLALTTVMDVETTFHGVQQSRGREVNPVLRPVVGKGRDATYGLIGAINVLPLLHSFRMKESGNKWWWTIPIALGGVHALVAASNSSIRPRAQAKR